MEVQPPDATTRAVRSAQSQATATRMPRKAWKPIHICEYIADDRV